MKKKAFTLVELLVSITIVSILATVSIISYNKFISQANLTRDKAIMLQMNLILKGNEYSDFEHTMTSALKQVGEELSSSQMELSTSNAIWGYDSSTNRFVIIKDGDVIVSDHSGYGEKYEIFVEVHNQMDILFNSLDYAIYLADDFEGTKVSHCAGIDVGNNTQVTRVIYKNVTSTCPKDAVIKTNSPDCTVYIYAPDDHVEHYGEAKEIYVVSVDHYSSYHEYGTIGDLRVTSGRIVIENEGYVTNLIECDYSFTSGINIYETAYDISSIVIKGKVENYN